MGRAEELSYEDESRRLAVRFDEPALRLFVLGNSAVGFAVDSLATIATEDTWFCGVALLAGGRRLVAADKAGRVLLYEV